MQMTSLLANVFLFPSVITCGVAMPCSSLWHHRTSVWSAAPQHRVRKDVARATLYCYRRPLLGSPELRCLIYDAVDSPGAHMHACTCTALSVTAGQPLSRRLRSRLRRHSPAPVSRSHADRCRCDSPSGSACSQSLGFSVQR